MFPKDIMKKRFQCSFNVFGNQKIARLVSIIPNMRKKNYEKSLIICYVPKFQQENQPAQ
jgi:hypothetical protein